MTVGSEPVVETGADTAELERAIDRRVVRGSAWIGLSHGGHTLLWMITLLVLAHLLTPADFGVASIAGTFLIVIAYIQQGGVSAALVQRKTEVREAAASALLFSLVTGAAVYAAIFVLAPVFGVFFHSDRLGDVLRVLAIAIAIRSTTWIAVALLERQLAFARVAAGELAGACTEAGLAIGLAFAGAGVWSIVWGQVGGAVVECGLTWALVRERPVFRHRSRRVLGELLRFGRYISAGSLLLLLSSSVDNIVVGRILGTHALGFYAVSYRLAALPGAVLGVVADRVAFPAYSMLTENPRGFARSYLANVERLVLLAFPLGVGLVVAADPLVVGLLGERWQPAVEPLRILAVWGLLDAITGTTGSVFLAANRPHLVPLTSLVGLAVLVPLLWFLTRSFGTTGAASAMVLALVPVVALRVGLAIRILSVRVGDLARVLLPPAACAALLGAALLGLLEASSGLGPAATLAVLVTGGLASYALAAAVLARHALEPIVAGLRRRPT